MKIARYRIGSGPVRLGRVDGARVTEISGVAGIGASLKEILPRLGELRDQIADAAGDTHALSEVTLLAPVDEPQKYLGIGMNYKEHAEEARQAGIPIPTSQLWFNKQVSCIVGPHADVEKPIVSDALDYEIELAVVIGRRCRHVGAADARSVIAGYMVANDVSVRDWLQKRSPTFTLGKSFDTHGPLGPWLTTDDEVPNPLDLGMRLTVNGEVRQDFRTNDMIYDIYEQIAYLSTVMTLMPGDILATGTPAGIGAPTGSFLRVGDVVRAEIEGLGAIENTIVAEPAV
ncbi:fumarylacetoacetate hydrolase family protein [Demequina sp. SYSU T00039]|uniref:Fumarylacetoacetate hydrolase family protein n=1 Tax=Demequina lignilytica TaxID=3051663 RepID=A0AAW7M7G4_9MICO|nr:MULTISPECIES: fumarylacetoacetate hydrolase family protein [unclassified Demequina]MDN4478976.1 fumarylacetoacetate hydrolase family protein [Demequina sp. SYSU T00039-1]MDN4488851.1 fumarylacetoacetate hydrolase family protein [Demequina sp. SYSU T00039]MDN4491436.1 fumarylacetoacetate hydrolase family protein [Demequina sp. SYSU T00068]